MAIDQWIEDLLSAWNAHDVERVAAFYAPDYEGEDVAEAAPQRGPDGVRASLDRYLRAFPDLQFSADEVIIQGNRVALAWTARGTHQGTLMSVPGRAGRSRYGVSRC